MFQNSKFTYPNIKFLSLFSERVHNIINFLHSFTQWWTGTYCSNCIIICVEHGSTEANSTSAKVGQGKKLDYPPPVSVSYLPTTATLILVTALSPSHPLRPSHSLMFWALYCSWEAEMCALVGSVGEQESETNPQQPCSFFPWPEYNQEIRLLQTPRTHQCLHSQPLAI